MNRPAFVSAVIVGVGLLVTAAVHADPAIRVTQLDHEYYLIADDTANLVLYAGAEGSLLAGIQRPALVARAKQIIQTQHAGPIRYVLITEDSSSIPYLDGGWGRDGAITVAHESLINRLRPSPNEAQVTPAAPGFAPPVMGFSQVVQLWVGGEEIHFIHQRSGYTDADVIVHFENTGMLYLGNTVTMDGYPEIDVSRGGALKGMIDTAHFFITPDWRPERLEPIVPGRGPVATVKDLTAYHDMLVTIRDRVRAGVDAGMSLDDIIAGHPTDEFDARWGHGPVSSAQFIKMVHQSVTQPTSRR